MRMAVAQGEDWAMTMEKTMKAVKDHARIAEEIYKQVKRDWLEKLIEHERLTTHEKKLQAGIAKNLK